jgi:hypothetical protein
LPHRRRNARTRNELAEQGSKKLAELFRPPIDIIERVDFNTLRQMAQDQDRWILANVQVIF